MGDTTRTALFISSFTFCIVCMLDVSKPNSPVFGTVAKAWCTGHDAAAGFEVALFIDVHAHSTSRHSFLFCNQPSIAAGFSPSTPAYQQGVAYGASAQPNTRPQEQTPSFGSAFLQSIGYSAGPLPSPPLPVGFGSYGWYSQPAAPASLTFGHSSSQAINQQGSDRSGRSSASCQTPSQPLHPLDPQAAVDRVMRLPKLMENMCPGFSAASCVFDGESAKAGSARRVVGDLNLSHNAGAELLYYIVTPQHTAWNAMNLVLRWAGMS